jgi:hypothetical protein
MARVIGFSALFLVLGSPVTATPSKSPEQLQVEQAIQEIMDAAMAKMFEPGPVQAGWNKGGVDIYKVVEARSGGAAANLLLVEDKDGEVSVRMVRGRDLGGVVPKDWKPILRAGSAQQPSESDVLEIAHLDGPFYFAGWEGHRRNGDAFCTDGKMGGELYETSDKTNEGDIPRELIPTFFHATVKRMESQVVCWRYDRDGDGYKVSYFLEDGRTLPQVNEHNERVTIVPAGPVSALLKPPQKTR